MGLMSGDKPQHKMKIEKSLLLLKGSLQLLSHHNISSPPHPVRGTDEATGQLLDHLQASGGRREEDGKEGNPGREAKLLVMGGGECIFSFPCQSRCL